MTSFIDRIRQLVWGREAIEAESEPAPDSFALEGEAMRRLMTALSKTHDEELSCGEVYELIDEYADHVVEDDDAAELMPLVAHHIDMCSDCRDEYQLLLKTLGADDAPIA